MNRRHPPLVIWQEWAREKAAFVIAMSSDKVAAIHADDDCISRLPPGLITLNLYAPTCEPIAILSDIYAAMRTATEFGYVIAQIYGLSDAMLDVGMRPGDINA